MFKIWFGRLKIFFFSGRGLLVVDRLCKALKNFLEYMYHLRLDWYGCVDCLGEKYWCFEFIQNRFFYEVLTNRAPWESRLNGNWIQFGWKLLVLKAGIWLCGQQSPGLFYGKNLWQLYVEIRLLCFSLSLVA